MPIEHKHLIVRAMVTNPLTNAEECNAWLRELIGAIDMQILMGPFSAYENSEGNRGLTGVVILTTSHAAIHFWDESNPGLMEFDLYSCKNFDVGIVYNFLQKFNPVKIEWKFLDRTNGLEEIPIAFA